jgi:hypothetical protein
MFSSGQRAAVAAAFRLAGLVAVPGTAPVDSEDERVFLLDAGLPATGNLRDLEQILQQLLGRKVWIVERTDKWSPASVPFE